MTTYKSVVAAFTLCLVLAAVSGCAPEVSTSVRSGSVHDDFVEEPLPDDVRKYEPVLRVSNTVMEQVLAGDYSTVHRMLVPQVAAQLSEAQLQKGLAELHDSLGPVRAYKPMQWGFSFGEHEGIPLIQSTKIVRHEKGDVLYTLVFKRDGSLDQLLGFYAKPRPHKEQPAHAAVPVG